MGDRLGIEKFQKLLARSVFTRFQNQWYQWKAETMAHQDSYTKSCAKSETGEPAGFACCRFCAKILTLYREIFDRFGPILDQICQFLTNLRRFVTEYRKFLINLHKLFDQSRPICDEIQAFFDKFTPICVEIRHFVSNYDNFWWIYSVCDNDVILGQIFQMYNNRNRVDKQCLCEWEQHEIITITLSKIRTTCYELGHFVTNLDSKFKFNSLLS